MGKQEPSERRWCAQDNTARDTGPTPLTFSRTPSSPGLSFWKLNKSRSRKISQGNPPPKRGGTQHSAAQAFPKGSTNMRLQRPLVLPSLISAPKTSNYFTQPTQDQSHPQGLAPYLTLEAIPSQGLQEELRDWAVKQWWQSIKDVVSDLSLRA